MHALMCIYIYIHIYVRDRRRHRSPVAELGVEVDDELLLGVR
jgi:hypothetical protein